MRSFVRAPLATLLLASCGFDAGGVGGAGTQGVGDEGTSSSDTGMPGTTAPSSTSIGETSSEGSSAGGVEGPTSSESSGLPPIESSSSSDASESSGGAPVPCLDLLWISNVEDPTGTTDAPLVSRLESLGYAITFMRDDVAVAGDADGRCAVLISAVSESGDIEAEFYATPTPVVIWEYALFDDMGFGAGHGQDGELDIIVVGDDELAAGLSGEQVLYAGDGRINWAMIDSGKVIATRNDGSGHATMFAYDAGAMLEDGSPAAGARVALPFSNVPGGTLQEPALALFEAAVVWAVQQ